MFIIDIRSSVPIFEQLYHEIGKYIALGVLKPDDQLPTVRTLAKELGINPNTVSKAYQEAERSGLVYAIVGVGMFVSNTQVGVNSVIEEAYDRLADAYKSLTDLGQSKEVIFQRMEDIVS